MRRGTRKESMSESARFAPRTATTAPSAARSNSAVQLPHIPTLPRDLTVAAPVSFQSAHKRNQYGEFAFGNTGAGTDSAVSPRAAPPRNAPPPLPPPNRGGSNVPPPVDPKQAKIIYEEFKGQPSMRKGDFPPPSNDNASTRH